MDRSAARLGSEVRVLEQPGVLPKQDTSCVEGLIDVFLGEDLTAKLEAYGLRHLARRRAVHLNAVLSKNIMGHRQTQISLLGK